MTDTADFVGTSEGARRAWESRRAGSSPAPAPVPEPQVEPPLAPTAAPPPAPKKLSMATVVGVGQAFGSIQGANYSTKTTLLANNSVLVKLVGADGNQIGAARRRVIKGTDGKIEVHHTFFEINKKEQRKGYGAAFLRDSVAMYERAGVDKVTVDAATDHKLNGAYTWARLGFSIEPWSRKSLYYRVKSVANSPYEELGLADKHSMLALADSIDKGMSMQDVASHPLGKKLLLGKFGDISWYGYLPVRKHGTLTASADTGDINYDDWADVEQGLDPYDETLTAAGTPEGAVKAWQSRHRADPNVVRPDLSSPAGVRKAFTLHGTLYDTEVIEAKDTNYDDADDGTAQIVRVALLNKAGQKMGEATRTVATVDGETEVYHDEFELGTNYQRHGVGSEFLSDSVKMYDAAGVDHVAVLAGSNAWSNGAYTWARLGFQLNPKWRDPFVSKMTTQMEHPAFPLEDRPAWRDLAEKVSTGKATIQDVAAAPHGKDFLLGQFGTLTWHGILPISKQAKYALAASAESTADIDYDDWAAVEQGLDPWADDTLTADAGELVDDETDRQATAAVRAAYRAAIDLVAPRVLARIEAARATNRALVAAGNGEHDQIITDEEWSAIAAEHVDDTIGDGVLDGVVAGATQFLKLATPSSVAKAFAAAAASFAGFANELRSKIDSWIGNKIGQGITGDWGIGRVIEELGLSSPLSPDKADLVAGTETQAAVNAGTYAALQVAAPAALRWVTERDERVRPTHVIADTDTVPFGELFTVGGSPARFPGDPNLPAKERFNCRCHLAYVEGTEARRVVGATKAELRSKAAALSVSGRSTMNKGQLQSAVLNELCLQGMAGGPDCPDVLDQWNRTALLSAARGEGIAGRHRMSREELIYQLRQTLRGGNTAMVAKGYSTSQELARAQKKAVYKRGRAKPGEFASSSVPSPEARRASRRSLFAEFGGEAAGSVPCVHCGLRLAPDAGSGLAVLVPEPIVPWSQGGSLALSNMVPSCPACFRARGGTGLVSAGTPEGAKKAWESRQRADHPASFTDEDSVRAAFTLHGDTYDAEAGNVDQIDMGTDRMIYEVTSTLFDKEKRIIGVSNRQIEIAGGRTEVHHDVFHLRARAQGQGVGAEYLRDSVEMYKRAGVDTVTVDATSDSTYGNGAYTWARLGFTPKDKDLPYIADRYRKAAGSTEQGRSDDAWLTDRIAYANSFANGNVSIQELSQDPIGKKLLLGDFGDLTWEGYIDVAKGLAAAAVSTDDIDYDLWAQTELDASAGDELEALAAAGTPEGAVKAWESRDRAAPATAEEFGKQVPSKRTTRPAEWFASKAELAGTRKLIAQKIRDLPKPTKAQIAKNKRMLRRAETHGRAGGELRGNSMTRRARGEALFAEFGGDEKGYCPCGYCGLKVSPRGRGGYAAMQQDKILTAAEGGKYGTPTSFPNLIPSCAGCNASRNDEPYHIRPEWDLPLAAAADIAVDSIAPADGATVVAFPLGWDDPEIDTVDRPIEGILAHRTVGPEGHQYVQWLCGGEVIDPATITTDGLTAAGTSEGAVKAWESRDHGVGDLHAAVAAIAQFDQGAAEDRQRDFEAKYRTYDSDGVPLRNNSNDWVGDYGDWAYQDINKALRGEGPTDNPELTDLIDKSIAGLDQTIADLGSAAPAGLLRGKGEGSRLVELGWKVGHEFTDKGYGSWTPDPKVALHFAKDAGKGAVVMRLTNSAGIRSIPGKEGEYESILPHGMTYRVTGITDYVGPDGTKHRLMDVEAVNALTAAGTSEGARRAWESRQRAKHPVAEAPAAATPAGLEQYTVDASVPPRRTKAGYGASYDGPDGFQPLSEFYDETLAKRGKGFTETSVADLKKRMAADPIAVRMTPKGINGLVADGRFKTIAETKSSRGKGRYAEYRQARQTYEFSRLGVDLNDKAKTPVYGYLAHGDESAWAVDSYGAYEVRLKDHVKHRASVTEGDSLNGLRPVAFGEAATASDADWWQAHEAGAREFALAKGKVPKDVHYDDASPPSATFKPVYTEAQVYGGVSLSDVSEVIVHAGAPLSAKTRAGLVKAGVKITEVA